MQNLLQGLQFITITLSGLGTTDYSGSPLGEPAAWLPSGSSPPFYAGIQRVQPNNNHKNKNLEESPMQKSLPCFALSYLLPQPATFTTPAIFIREALNKLIPLMVRQAHNERKQQLAARPEPIEGLVQAFPKASN